MEVNDDSSEDKYNTALAISSGVAILPNGCISRILFLSFGETSFALSVIGVSTKPGHTAFTRILFLAYSKAIDLVRPIIACLLC